MNSALLLSIFLVLTITDNLVAYQTEMDMDLETSPPTAQSTFTSMSTEPEPVEDEDDFHWTAMDMDRGEINTRCFVRFRRESRRPYSLHVQCGSASGYISDSSRPLIVIMVADIKNSRESETFSIIHPREDVTSYYTIEAPISVELSRALSDNGIAYEKTGEIYADKFVLPGDTQLYEVLIDKQVAPIGFVSSPGHEVTLAERAFHFLKGEKQLSTEAQAYQTDRVHRLETDAFKTPVLNTVLTILGKNALGAEDTFHYVAEGKTESYSINWTIKRNGSAVESGGMSISKANGVVQHTPSR